MIIQPIVEGQGEVSAVPVLLRRLRDETGVSGVSIARPYRKHRTKLVQKDTLQQTVSMALKTRCIGILILFDADDDCPKERTPTLEQWARDIAGTTPCSVVMANREYEAWFLASIDSLRGTRRIRQDATAHQTPETPRDAKSQLEQRMEYGRCYSPTVDQASLTARFDLETAYRRCRSFRKLVSAVGMLLKASNALPDPWPPTTWTR